MFLFNSVGVGVTRIIILYFFFDSGRKIVRLFFFWVNLKSESDEWISE